MVYLGGKTQYTLAKKAILRYLTTHPGTTSTDMWHALFMKGRRTDGLRPNDPWVWLSNIRREELIRSQHGEGKLLRWWLTEKGQCVISLSDSSGSPTVSGKVSLL